MPIRLSSQLAVLSILFVTPIQGSTVIRQSAQPAVGSTASAVLGASHVAGDTSLGSRVDAFVEPYVRENLWSGAIAVVMGDSVLHLAGYGLADLDRRTPNTPTTRFGAASVSKTFTKVAALRLAQAGFIDLDATIDRWIPRFPGGDRITVGHLLSHRSGIRDTDDLGWFRLGQREPHSLAELVDSLAAAGLEFEPGERYNYSNGGFTVLAAVLEAAAGQPFPDVMERWVFRPAGMTSSGDLAARRAVDGLATGYLLNSDGQLAPGPPSHPSNKIGAGSAYTTAEDLVAFYRALRANRLLPAAVRDSLFRPIDSPIGLPRLYFGGRGPSYTASVQLFLEDGAPAAMVAALGNNYGRLNEEITDGVAALLYGDWEDERIERILGRQLPFAGHPLSDEVLDRLAGRYRHQWGFEFTLEREGPWQLVYVDPEHGTRTPMVGRSDDTLVSPWQWAELEWASEDETGAEDGSSRKGVVSWRWLDFPADSWSVERIDD